MFLIFPGFMDTAPSVPTKVQLFAQWKKCRHKLIDKVWEEITGPVTFSALNILDIHVKQPIPVICMKLVIHEMSSDQIVRIKGVTALYETHAATEMILTKEWSGDAPSMSSFCRKEVDEALVASHNSCEQRPLDALYDLHSGFVTCQCDEFCTKFNDCCSDYSHVGYPNSSLAAASDQTDKLFISCESIQFPQQSHPGMGVYVVISCLANHEDTDYSHQCRGSGQLAFIPVESHGIVYRNVYCALCNDIPPEDITPWRASTWGAVASTALQCQRDMESSIGQVLANGTAEGDIDCFWRSGFSHPWEGNLLSGEHRLGKLCTIDKHHGQSSLAKPPTFLLQEATKVRIIKDPQCFCDHCHSSVFDYLTADMSKITDFFLLETTPWLYATLLNEIGHDGGFSGIFKPQEREKEKEDKDDRLWAEIRPILDDDEDEDKGKDASSKKKLSFRLISLIGSGSSALLLLGILVHLIKNGGKSTEAQRIQIGILVGKILLFIAFMGRYLFRRYGIPCKIFAVLVHYAMYVSFGNMIWFGLSVAKLLWSVENNMAGLSIENRNDDIRKREWITWGIIWIGMLGLVMGFWSYDTYLDANFFVYGRNEICLMAGRKAVLYLIVVPTTTIVVFNAGLIIYCVTQYLRMMDKRPKMGKNLLTFLARLMALQTSQWGFGIAYYFTENITMQYIFEVFVAFEGTLIALTRCMIKT